jgi:lipid-binding SYLF domain-containing protein
VPTTDNDDKFSKIVQVALRGNFSHIANPIGRANAAAKVLLNSSPK